MHTQPIPIATLEMQPNEAATPYRRPILENEIEGIGVEHLALSAESHTIDPTDPNQRLIYLFIKGSGTATVANTVYEIVPETILVPNVAEELSIEAAKDEGLHYLRISAELTPQDHLDLKAFDPNNTQNVYYAKFTDCQSYAEQIKSPTTVSRTILPNKIIPRVAMGTVQTVGPDEVGAHEHPMLEQLFLGLSNNSCTVYADEAAAHFAQHTILHIPLGSRHSVSVDADKTMYYVWMDFFMDSAGEAWLENHKNHDDE